MACRPKSEICLKDENNQCVEPFQVDPGLNLTVIGGPYVIEADCLTDCPTTTTTPPPGRCCQILAGGEYIGPGQLAEGNPGLEDPANWSNIGTVCTDNLYPGTDPDANCTTGLLAGGLNGVAVAAYFTPNVSCDYSSGISGGCCGEPCPQGYVGSGPINPQDFSEGLTCCPNSHPVHIGDCLCAVDYENTSDTVPCTLVDQGCYYDGF